ncbi:MAG: FixH family protein [Actinobacteria bacterium]|nr:FixH family protein [Actinomycetota bacterium]
MKRPNILRPLVGVLCLVLAIAAGAPIAAAHGDEGKLEVVSVTPSGTTAVVTVRLTYGNDAEAVESATVTIAGDDGAGTRLDPVPMQRTQLPGEYTADVSFPSAGTWKLRVTSVTPAATLTLTQDITADPGVTASTGTSLDATTSSTPRPTDGEQSGKPLVSTAPSSTGDGGGSGSTTWIVVGVVAVVVVLGAAVLVARRRSGGSSAE